MSLTLQCEISSEILSTKWNPTSKPLLTFNFSIQPGPAEIPPPIRRRDRNPQDLGGFFRGEANEVTELDEFGLLFVPEGEFLQGITYRQYFLIFCRGGNFNFMNVEPGYAATVALGTLAACILDQDAVHGLGRGAEEMPAVVPGLILLSNQPQPSFVNKGGGLQGLACRFIGHLVRGQTS